MSTDPFNNSLHSTEYFVFFLLSFVLKMKNSFLASTAIFVWGGRKKNKQPSLEGRKKEVSSLLDVSLVSLISLSDTLRTRTHTQAAKYCAGDRKYEEK